MSEPIEWLVSQLLNQYSSGGALQETSTQVAVLWVTPVMRVKGLCDHQRADKNMQQRHPPAEERHVHHIEHSYWNFLA